MDELSMALVGDLQPDVINIEARNHCVRLKWYFPEGHGVVVHMCSNFETVISRIGQTNEYPFTKPNLLYLLERRGQWIA